MQNILPYKVYQLLIARLTEKFSHIATITLTIEATAPVVTEELVLDYWLPTIRQLEDMSPPLKNQLMRQKPQWTGHKLIATTMHEIEQMSLKSKYTDKLSESYQQFGFPSIPLEFQLVEQSDEMKQAHEAFWSSVDKKKPY